MPSNALLHLALEPAQALLLCESSSRDELDPARLPHAMTGGAREDVWEQIRRLAPGMRLAIPFGADP